MRTSLPAAVKPMSMDDIYQGSITHVVKIIIIIIIVIVVVVAKVREWYSHVSRSSGLTKTILQGAVKEVRRQGRQRKRWEDNIREWRGLEFAKSQRAVENRERRKMEDTGREAICGASMIPAVRG